jgi:hypothetical protein
MRRIVAAAIALTVGIGPVLAQPRPQPWQQKREDEKKQTDHRAVEKAYNESIRRGRTDAPPPKTDPWRTVRPSESEKKPDAEKK